MMLDGNKGVKIKNSSITILAIILVAVYFITDFLFDRQLVIAGIYVVILGLSVCLCAKKVSFYEAVYNLIVLVILAEILKNCVPHLKNPGWFWETLIKQFKFSAESYMDGLLSTPYIYFYLIGMLLLTICKFAPNLCQSIAMRNVFNTLGKYSLGAVVIHMCAVGFYKYELIENVIFEIFIISAFWTAYTKEEFEVAEVEKAVLLVVEISLFILLYPEQYTAFVENFQNMQNITGIYSVGLFIICVLCLISEKIVQDIFIGFILLGTNILVLYGRLNQVTINPANIVFFHICALSFYYIAKNAAASDNEYQNKQYLKIFLMVSYMMVFPLTIFIVNHFTESIIIFCMGLLFMIIYFGDFAGIKGTIYGTAIYGAIPWILLEITMNSLDKMKVPLFSVILFTILFWCSCSVALSWRDTAGIKSIVFEKNNSEMIINGLAGSAYILTVLVLFM